MTPQQGPDALATEGGPKSSDIKQLSDLTTEMIRAQNENTYKERSMQEIDQILSHVYDDDVLGTQLVSLFFSRTSAR